MWQENISCVAFDYFSYPIGRYVCLFLAKNEQNVDFFVCEENKTIIISNIYILLLLFLAVNAVLAEYDQSK